MRTEIKLLHQRLSGTIIYITHDQIEAMTLADRIVVMRDGRIEQEGTPLVVLLHARVKVHPGEVIKLRVAASDIHLFDAKTSIRI